MSLNCQIRFDQNIKNVRKQKMSHLHRKSFIILKLIKKTFLTQFIFDETL